MAVSAYYFPLYVADYTVDTQHLGTEEHGAYLLLLMAMWTSGGSLPFENRSLARICKTNTKRFTMVLWPQLQGFFTEIEGGRITQKRLKAHWDKYVETAQKRASSSVQGGEATKRKFEGLFPAVEPQKTAKRGRPSGRPNGHKFGRSSEGRSAPYIYKDSISPLTPLKGGIVNNSDSKNAPPAREPEIEVKVIDERWRSLAARYEQERGKRPPVAKGSWYFPASWVQTPAVEQSENSNTG